MADEENEKTAAPDNEKPSDAETLENSEAEKVSEEKPEEKAVEQSALSEESREAPSGLSVFGFIGLGLIAWGVFSVFRHNPFWIVLGVGLVMYGADDLAASLRDKVKRPWNLGLNLFRTLFFIGSGLYIIAAATSLAAEPQTGVLTVVWMTFLLAYLTLVILSGILSKDKVEIGPVFLMASLMFAGASFFYFAQFLHLSLAGGLSMAALVCALIALWKGALRELPSQGLTAIIFLLLLSAPFTIYIFQHSREELQPLVSKPFHLVTQDHIADLSKEDTQDLKWAPSPFGISEELSSEGQILKSQPRRSQKIEFSINATNKDRWKDTETLGGQRYTFIYQESRNNTEEWSDKEAGNKGVVKVYAMNPDSSGYWWSPDATRIAFTEYNPQSESYDLRVIDERLDELIDIGGKQGHPEEAGEVSVKTSAKGKYYRVMKKAEVIYGGRVWPMVEDHGQLWSRDSHELLFAAPVSDYKEKMNQIKKGKTKIYKVNLKTRHVKALTSGDTKIYPAWAPDESRIAYVSYKNVRPYLEMAEGNGSRPRAFKWKREQPYFPAWNKAQTRVLYIKGGKLWLMNSNGTRKRKFTSRSIKSKIWFTSKKKKFLLDWRDPADSWQIKDMASDGKGKHRLLFTCKEGICDEIFPPIYSPDSKRIAFVVRQNKNYMVYTMGRDGDREGDWATRFFATGDKVGSLKWSPQSNKLAFLVRRRDEPVEEIWTVDYNRNDRDVLKPKKAYETEARISSLNWSPTEEFLAFEEKRRWGLMGWDIVVPDIYRVMVLDLPSEKTRPIYPFSQYSRQPAFSPNGSLLAFIGDNSPGFQMSDDKAAIWLVQLQ